MTADARDREWAQGLVEKIDRVSRTRRLDDAESRLLEWAIGLADGAHSNTRVPHQGNVTMARLGIKRDMRIYKPMKTVPRTSGSGSREALRKTMIRKRPHVRDPGPEGCPGCDDELGL